MEYIDPTKVIDACEQLGKFTATDVMVVLGVSDRKRVGAVVSSLCKRGCVKQTGSQIINPETNKPLIEFEFVTKKKAPRGYGPRPMPVAEKPKPETVDTVTEFQHAMMDVLEIIDQLSDSVRGIMGKFEPVDQSELDKLRKVRDILSR